MQFDTEEKSLKGLRKIKKALIPILKSDNWNENLIDFAEKYDFRISGPLFSLICGNDIEIKNKALKGFSILGSMDTDRARILIRRAVWMLTEESGGLPWGAPEAIGEIIAANRQLAIEFSKLLISYVDEIEEGPDNYIDHTPLRTGAYYSLLLLSETYPELMEDSWKLLYRCVFKENTAASLALLLLIIQNLNAAELIPMIEQKKFPDARVELHRYDQVHIYSLKILAEETIKKLKVQ